MIRGIVALVLLVFSTLTLATSDLLNLKEENAGQIKDFDFNSLVGPLSALAAAISALIAYLAIRNALKADRDRQIREISLLANKVISSSVRIDDLAMQLKQAYQTLFTFAGRGGASSRVKLYIVEIERKQTGIGPFQQAARDVIGKDVTKLSDEQITERLLEFDGYLAHLDRIHEKFNFDLASVESQNQLYRMDVIKK